MKSIILALIISIIIHILLFFTPVSIFKIDKDKPQPPKKIEKKSNVKYVKLQPRVVPKKEPAKKVVPKEPIKQPKGFKKVVPKKIKPQKVQKKEPPKKIPKPTVNKVEKKSTPKRVTKINPQAKRKTTDRSNLENFLLSEPVPVNKKMLDKMTQSYIDLYGKDYEKFTNVQKVFIQNHIRTIVEIIRSYFNFPDLAIKMSLNDYNEVKFILHPNGDISDLKMQKKGEYEVYDKAILETIEYAYKDFPRPKEPTQIRIYINYITHH